MSKGRSVRKTGVRNQGSGVRGKDVAALPRIGETHEEILAALERGMRDLLAGRITVKQANRITHAANMQLHRLRVLEWLERMAKRQKGQSNCIAVQKLHRHRGGPPWVN